jgi:hypothetical protein
MWWTWETEWSTFEDPTLQTQGVVLHPLPLPAGADGSVPRTAFATTAIHVAAGGQVVVQPGRVGCFGDVYPEDFAPEAPYQTIARFLAFLNSPYIPREGLVPTRQARRWTERQGVPDLLEDEVQFLLLRRERHDGGDPAGDAPSTTTAGWCRGTSAPSGIPRRKPTKSSG